MDPRPQATAHVSGSRLKWPRQFSEHRKPKDSRPFVDKFRQFDTPKDGVELFMKPYDDDRAKAYYEAVTRVTNNVTVAKINDQQKPRTAWLDDRPETLSARELDAHRNGSETFIPILFEETERDITSAHSPVAVDRKPRRYPDLLTARDFHSHLRERRSDHERLEDVARRLIHIADPDGYDFLALTETAPEDQSRALREQLGKYCTQQTSLKVKISPQGYRVFQLQMHIPYFSIRPASLEDLREGSWKQKHPDWKDLSFLDKDSGRDGVLGMHKGQVSLTICGSNNSYWTAYCFDKASFDDDRDIGEYEEGSAFRTDPISRGELATDTSIRDPREYFIAVLQIWLSYVTEEMEELVMRAENSLEQKTSASASDSPTSEWIEQMLNLATCCIQNISKLINEWGSFQFSYFEDATSPDLEERMQDTLTSLSETICTMGSFEKRFRLVQEGCEGQRKILEHRQLRQNCQIASQTVLLYSPIVILTAIFAIPAKVVPYKITTLSFSLTIGICEILSISFGLFVGWVDGQFLLQTLEAFLQRLRESAKWLSGSKLDGREVPATDATNV